MSLYFDFGHDGERPDKKSKINYPIGGFAKGNYTSTCRDCKESFMGDKRAVQCEPCAINAVNKSNTQALAKLSKIDDALKKIQFGNTQINNILNMDSSPPTFREYIIKERSEFFHNTSVSDMMKTGSVKIRDEEWFASLYTEYKILYGDKIP